MIARSTLVLPVVLAMSALAHAAPRPIFPNPGYPVGADPIALTSGDFNGDGIRDIAVANRFTEDLSVLIGLGEGAFRQEQRYPLPDVPVDVLTADLDGDGADDLVVALARLDAVGILRSNGAGHFGPAMLVPTGDSPSALGTGDFNDDGHADLAVAHFFGDGAVLFGHGDGAFGPPQPVPAGLQSSDLAVTDLDRDGRLDILIINSASKDLSVLMGTGDGHFAALPPVPAGSGDPYFHPVQLVTRDFDSDGYPDVLFVDFSNADEVNSVDTLEGHGDGTFEPGSHVAALADGEVGVAIGDFDDDGHDDLALTFHHGGFCCTNRSGDIYRGSGHGTFAVGESFYTGVGPVALLQADFDGDGKEDIAALSQFPGLVTLLLGQGQGILGTRIPGLEVPSTYVIAPEDIATDDLDSDGHPDLLVGRGAAPELPLFYGQGDGSFTPRQNLATAGAPAGSLVADFDGDNRRDIVVATEGPLPGLFLHRGIGGRSFAPAVLIVSIQGTREIRALDLDHDDLPDLAVITSVEPRRIMLIRNLGGGSFASPLLLPMDASPRMFTAGDLDGDGFSDLVIVTVSSEVLALRGLGNGSFSSPIPLPGSADAVQLIDMNGDRRLDLMGLYTDFVWWPGHGDGSFGLPIVLGVAGPIHMFTASDFNGDGIPDIAFTPAGEVNDAVGILTGRIDGALGETSYSLPQVPSYESFESGLKSADFDHDGRMDLVVAHAGNLLVLLNQGPFPNHAPHAEATAASSAECTSPDGAAVLLNGTASSDPDSTPGTVDDIAAYEWFEDFSLPARRLVGQGALLTTTLPLGNHALTLRVTDQAGATSTGDVVVRVVDTIAPGATLRLAPERLWPANHKMIDVRALLSISDACGPTQVILQSVTSSEPDGSADTGDAATLGDISDAAIGTADFTFRLRAERLGGGTGRVYTVRYLATDMSGNGTVAEATVIVSRTPGTGAGPGSPHGGRRTSPGPKSPKPRD